MISFTGERIIESELILNAMKSLLKNYSLDEAKDAILDQLSKVPTVSEVPIPQIEVQFPNPKPMRKRKRATPHIYEELKKSYQHTINQQVE